MMDPTTGEFRMIDDVEARRVLDGQAADEVRLLIHGTEDQMRALSTRVRLGDKELANRARRRREQKASRRRNRLRITGGDVPSLSWSSARGPKRWLHQTPPGR